ncbi:MAG: hypothetical protein KGI43_08810 [Alphaproteobacteria bacterium]|nr:hypothetical protein [Alphaproteobacteria bacterium]
MSSATANTARMIAKLLAERQTAHQEIPQLIDVVHRTLAGLNGTRPVQGPAQQNGQTAPNEADAISVAPKRHGRKPRAEAAPIVSIPAETKATPAPAPTLLRRAEVKDKEPVQVVPLTPPPSRERLTRGVVRWFDPQTRRGALRLQGVSGDLPFEPPLLERSSITRLFKGQEVEAELGGTTDTPQLVGFRVLAAGPATHVNPGMVRARQQKPVMVELKREALKRAAARDAAEALLPDRND